MLTRLTPPEIDAIAHMWSVIALASDVAPLIGAEIAEAVRVIWSSPPNIQMLLITPEGWSAMAAYVAEICGRPSPDFTPTVH